LLYKSFIKPIVKALSCLIALVDALHIVLARLKSSMRTGHLSN